jgi:hypothetical protein
MTSGLAIMLGVLALILGTIAAVVWHTWDATGED